MDIFGIILNVLGIGRDALNNRAKIKQLKAKQEHKIIEAQTKAEVDRIMSNTDSDNAIDLITAKEKRFSSKDEVVVYLFLTPVFIATIVPFIQAFKADDWTLLNDMIKKSYDTLNQLPKWYKYVLGAIIIDVLGFRSFSRKLIQKYLNK